MKNLLILVVLCCATSIASGQNVRREIYKEIDKIDTTNIAVLKKHYIDRASITNDMASLQMDVLELALNLNLIALGLDSIEVLDTIKIYSYNLQEVFSEIEMSEYIESTTVANILDGFRMCIIYQKFIVNISRAQRDRNVQEMIDVFNTYAEMRYIDLNIPLYTVSLGEDKVLLFEVHSKE